jgi:hypothetical protein
LKTGDSYPLSSIMLAGWLENDAVKGS